jgi:NitT/TauT family transport system permease protein
MEYLLPTLTFCGIVLAWHLIAVRFALPVWLLPSPERVYDTTTQWADELPRHTAITLGETIVGFALSFAFGVPIAMLIALSTILKRTIYPLLILLQSVPKVAVAPLLLIWLGHGLPPKIAVVFLVCFFPIVVSLTSGMEKTPPSLIDLAYTLKASRNQIFWRLRFPYSLPYLFVGLKVAITLAVIGAVIGEFVGSNEGLGYLIMVSTSQVNTSLAFGAMAILTVCSILLYYAVEALEALIIPWASKVRV